MNLNTEPVRLPLWATTVLVTAGQLAVALLNGVDWRAATATAIGSLVLLVGGTEVARGHAYAPATVDRIKQTIAAARPVVRKPKAAVTTIPSETARAVALGAEKPKTRKKPPRA